MSPIQSDKLHTVEAYFELEKTSIDKLEYHDGEIFAMAGGTPRHSRVISNMNAELVFALKGNPCEVYNSDLKIKAENSYVYPDISVLCQEPEYSDGRKDVVTNPILIIEVLSEGTEAYDRGGKFRKYRKIPSFKEYVLISQDTYNIDTFYRDDNDRWIIANYWLPEQALILHSLGKSILLSDIYDKIVF